MPKINNVAVVGVIVRGAGSDYATARAHALARLQAAANEVKAGRLPNDAGIQYFEEDPGGGGGPCAPAVKSVDYTTNAGGLPEAQ